MYSVNLFKFWPICQLNQIFFIGFLISCHFPVRFFPICLHLQNFPQTFLCFLSLQQYLCGSQPLLKAENRYPRSLRVFSAMGLWHSDWLLFDSVWLLAAVRFVLVLHCIQLDKGAWLVVPWPIFCELCLLKLKKIFIHWGSGQIFLSLQQLNLNLRSLQHSISPIGKAAVSPTTIIPNLGHSRRRLIWQVFGSNWMHFSFSHKSSNCHTINSQNWDAPVTNLK